MIERLKIQSEGLNLTEYSENDLRLQVPERLPSECFDDQNHGLSHCLKAVDFIIETPSHLLFIEFKDPDHPGAQEKAKVDFIAKLKSGSLDLELSQKFRDTWLYKKSENKINGKPIKYLVLIACSSLAAPELMSRAEELKKKLPVAGKVGQNWSWLVEDCAVFNLESWNKTFPVMPIQRISAA